MRYGTLCNEYQCFVLREETQFRVDIELDTEGIRTSGLATVTRSGVAT